MVYQQFSWLSLIAGILILLQSLSVFAGPQAFFIEFTVNQEDEAIVLNLEVAVCARQRSLGLQGRTSLADDAGMIFLIEPVEKVSMWMKDTYIPLDIMFIDTNDRIVGLEEAATPLTLRSINSPQAVAVVVEVNAGFIRRSGVQVGHKVHYQLPAGVLEHRCGAMPTR